MLGILIIDTYPLNVALRDDGLALPVSIPIHVEPDPQAQYQVAEPMAS